MNITDLVIEIAKYVTIGILSLSIIISIIYIILYSLDILKPEDRGL